MSNEISLLNQNQMNCSDQSKNPEKMENGIKE
jgi:hypothetical protein